MSRVLLGIFAFVAVVGLCLIVSEPANAGHGQSGCGCHGGHGGHGCHGYQRCHGYRNCCDPCCAPVQYGCHGGGGGVPVPADGDVPPPPPGDGDSPSDVPPGVGDGAPAVGTASYQRAPVVFRHISFRR